MEKTTVIALTLVIYKLVLVGIGFWARSRNRNAEDFFLGRIDNVHSLVAVAEMRRDLVSLVVQIERYLLAPGSGESRESMTEHWRAGHG